MTAGLTTLLRGLVDFAGLFPPAKLPFDEALRAYARYRQQPDAWMLGRFICPTKRLPELIPYLNERFATGAPLSVSALGRGGDTLTAFREGFQADLAAITDMRSQHGERVAIEVLETRLPVGVDVTELLAGLPATDIKLFGEVPLTATWRTDIPTVCTALQACGVGYKLRCGGLEASAFPALEQIALVLRSCQRLQVPLKCTAGLHHPLRRYDAGVQTTMHGFLNVFIAALLADQGADDATLLQVLSATTPDAFHFTDTGLRWQAFTISVNHIETARRRWTSFGSCSFEEPCADLRALGWLS